MHETKISKLTYGVISVGVVARKRVVQRVTKCGRPCQRFPMVTQTGQSNDMAVNPAEHAARRCLEAILPIAETDERPGRVHVCLPPVDRRVKDSRYNDLCQALIFWTRVSPVGAVAAHGVDE